MQRDPVQGPPKGFRKAIPVTVKLDVVIRQDGRCKACGERLGTLSNTQFDHTPAIQLRVWDAEAKDTVPPSNSAEHIEAKHNDCHLVKTTGRRGESKLNAVDGDVQKITKLRHLTDSEEAFRRRLLAKATGEQVEDKEKKGKRWPKRSFQRRGHGSADAGRSHGRDSDHATGGDQ